MRRDLSRVLFHESTILARLDELAEEITRDLAGEELTAVAVMNGSLMFVADSLRWVPLPLKIECIRVASYHEAPRAVERSPTRPRFPKSQAVMVPVLDDILDSGNTLHAISQRLQGEGAPKSVKICVLLRKRRERAHQVPADYVGFEIADEFVVGLRPDYAERHRNLPLIGVLRPELTPQG